uniref:Embryonic stem cell-specific 5-hydroxymethylcytosine-binding protein n=1 Tax=Physcomitrium patens TaxID=3218 RepID=A0A7I4AHN3_PHYPA
MCGRARCTVRVDAVGRACGFSAPLRSVNADRYQPSYNVAPGAHMPVVRHDGAGDAREPVVHCMRWGLVPNFAKKSEKPDFYRMFNARSESVHQKISFRRLLAKNRCLTTVEGFYEWKKDGQKKQPYYIHMQDGHPLVFAALYDTWESPEDRMPVILKGQDTIDSWLNDNLSEDVMKKLTQPYEAPDLIWYPVTPAMGKPAFNGPECIEEIKPKVAGESNIAQMFGKQLAQENKSHVNKVMSQDIKDEDFLNDEDFKALLAGMQPDQDVSEAVSHSEYSSLDRLNTQATPKEEAPPLIKPETKEEDPPLIKPETKEEDPPLIKPETKEEDPPLIKPETKEDHVPQTNKEEDSATAGVKQKQSNLLGFFSKE